MRSRRPRARVPDGPPKRESMRRPNSSSICCIGAAGASQKGILRPSRHNAGKHECGGPKDCGGEYRRRARAAAFRCRVAASCARSERPIPVTEKVVRIPGASLRGARREPEIHALAYNRLNPDSRAPPTPQNDRSGLPRLVLKVRPPGEELSPFTGHALSRPRSRERLADLIGNFLGIAEQHHGIVAVE